jgi:hypothetical protein
MTKEEILAAIQEIAMDQVKIANIIAQMRGKIIRLERRLVDSIEPSDEEAWKEFDQNFDGRRW